MLQNLLYQSVMTELSTPPF